MSSKNARSAEESPLESTVRSQLDQLNSHAASARLNQVDTMSPEYESNVAKLRLEWETQGRPVLMVLADIRRTIGKEFEAAAKMDYEGLRRSGIPMSRVQPLESLVDETIHFLNAATEQLSAIPGKIDRLTPLDEVSWKHGCKTSDEIRLEMKGVLSAPDELRSAFTKMKMLIARLVEAKQALSGTTPGAPKPFAQSYPQAKPTGDNDVN